MHTARRRLTAVLLVLLMGGGLGIPLSDALLNHRLPAQVRPGDTPLTEPGRPGGHTQSCLLQQATLAPRWAPLAPVVLPVHLAPVGAVALPPAPVFLDQTGQTSTYSRAPPGFSV